MAEEQKDDTPGSEGFSSQNQQNDESSLVNDGGDNGEASPGSFRPREDGGEAEGNAGLEDFSEKHPPVVHDIPQDGQGVESKPSASFVQIVSSTPEKDTGSSSSGMVQLASVEPQNPGEPMLLDFNGKSSSVEPVDDGGGYICRECGAWYKLRQSLNSHIQDQHQGKRFKCVKCTYSTNRRHDLYRHDAQVHRGERPNTPRNKPVLPKISLGVAAMKKREEKRLAKKVQPTTASPVTLQGEGSSPQQLIVISDGMQGAMYSDGSSPQQDRGSSASWLDDHSTRPHRQTESFEHQLPSGAIFRRITEITFFPDGRIRETRTEEYEMP